MATMTMNASTVETVTHTHEHGTASQEQDDWDWWHEWCDHNESAYLYLALEMLNYVQLMDVKDLRCKAQKIIRANEPERYCSRCPTCKLGTFDVWFAPSTLQVTHVECASALCTGQSYVDVPSGYVRSVAKWCRSIQVDHSENTPNRHAFDQKAKNDVNSNEPIIKRKRGRPPGSKNKKGTKKSRLLAARLLNQQ